MAKRKENIKPTKSINRAMSNRAMSDAAIEKAYSAGRATGARMAGARVTGAGSLPVVRQVRQNTISPVNGAKIQTPFRTPFGNGVVPANLRNVPGGYKGPKDPFSKMGPRGGGIRIGIRRGLGDR